MSGRIIAPYGVFSQSGIVGNNITSGNELLRLDSTFTNVNQDTQVVARVGDVVTGSLNWSRSIRLGGAQTARDFLVRPDLVTLDVEMGDMNGISVLRELKRLKVTSRVVNGAAT